MKIFLFVIGFILVIKGADYLITGASALAKKMGISSLIVGLTVVAFGTSVPELIINVFSAVQGKTDLAMGNIVGSNISNLLLILGLTSIIFPLQVKFSTVWKEIPYSFFAVVMLLIMTNDKIVEGGQSILGRIDGIVLIAFFGIFLYYVVEMAMKNKEELSIDEIVEGIDEKKVKMPVLIAMTIGGLIALFIGGKLVVDGAVFIAQKAGMSEFLISATIVALGSSMPELVTSLMAAYKKEPDLSVGNIIGSNIFNIFWVLGVTSIIRPIPVNGGINGHIYYLLIINILLFSFMFIGQKYKLERWQGIIFTAMYSGYILFIIFSR